MINVFQTGNYILAKLKIIPSKDILEGPVMMGKNKTKKLKAVIGATFAENYTIVGYSNFSHSCNASAYSICEERMKNGKLYECVNSTAVLRHS